MGNAQSVDEGASGTGPVEPQEKSAETKEKRQDELLKVFFQPVTSLPFPETPSSPTESGKGVSAKQPVARKPAHVRASVELQVGYDEVRWQECQFEAAFVDDIAATIKVRVVRTPRSGRRLVFRQCVLTTWSPRRYALRHNRTARRWNEKP